MILITYDIANDKLRTKFAKELEKYGYRLQYSVWRIDNSARILRNIKSVIESEYKKKFGEEDSVYIIEVPSDCKITAFGYAKNEDKELINIDRGS